LSTQHPEPAGFVRTKIVATIGPASKSPETLYDLFDAGVDVARLNFSHGTHEEHAETLRTIRAVAEKADRPIAVLQDLGGPKIRLGPIPGNEVACHLGERFTLVVDRTSDDPRQFTCTYRELPGDLKVGDQVLFADGAVEMEVVETTPEKATMVVRLAGKLRTRQGINLPGTNLSIPSLTEKDLDDLNWTAEHDVEYVGLSFVRTADDVHLLREELRKRNCSARIISKIEKPEAVHNLDAILAASDAVMVARGDLGVEMDVALVPAIQKRIITACHRARKPVITATQMLNSMETSNRPTRAEATDVFNAVLDGTDAVMLSGETAMGQYPLEAVETMSRIVAQAEAFLNQNGFDHTFSTPGTGWSNSGWIKPVTEGIVEAASLASRRLNAALVVVATHSGKTALAVSKFRRPTPTLALTEDERTARLMNLYWGVTPVVGPDLSDSTQSILAFAMGWAKSRKLIKPGDRLVYLRGTVPGNTVHNAMVVHEVG
jgi:pyruvate kinase